MGYKHGMFIHSCKQYFIKILLKKIVLILFVLLNNLAIAQENPRFSLLAKKKSHTQLNGSIGLNSPFSYKMMEPNQDLRKVNILNDERKNGVIKNRSLIIGTSLILIADYQRSNTESKFAYLMRHPTSANQIGKEVSEAVVHSFQLSFTGAVNNWLATYVELLYNPEQSFGEGTITSLGRNQIQLRKGFVVFGDLNKFPVYLAIGKMDAPFGQTGSVNPFSNSTMWHAFGGLGYGAQAGFNKWNIDASFMAVQGGAQFRAMHTPVGDSTNVPSKINNFAADFNYTIRIGNGFRFLLGGSYLYGSAYCQPFPVVHFNPCSKNNPAVTAYGKLKNKERIIIMGGYAKTLEVWPGTHNPTPPLDVFEATKVSSIDAGLKLNINLRGKVVYSLSGEFSNFRSGSDGAPWERQNQIVLGFAGMIRKSSKLFLEIFRTDGYVPLNFISGGNLGPGETHSVRDAFSYGIVFGSQITF
jgi:hypothetical protein